MVTTRTRTLVLFLALWLVLTLALLGWARLGSVVANSLLGWLLPLGSLCLILVLAARLATAGPAGRNAGGQSSDGDEKEDV
jgi:hypothetical protein